MHFVNDNEARFAMRAVPTSPITSSTSPGLRIVVRQYRDDAVVEVVDEELLTQFGDPLSAKQWRGDNNDMAVRVIEEILADNQPCLDCLAEPDFVRQQVALYGVFQDTPYHL
jgi:hypothetical protein